MLSALIWDVTNVILYRNKWIFDVIHAIMVLLSEMRVTVTAEYYKITDDTHTVLQIQIGGGKNDE